MTARAAPATVAARRGRVRSLLGLLNLSVDVCEGGLRGIEFLLRGFGAALRLIVDAAAGAQVGPCDYEDRDENGDKHPGGDAAERPLEGAGAFLRLPRARGVAGHRDGGIVPLVHGRGGGGLPCARVLGGGNGVGDLPVRGIVRGGDRGISALASAAAVETTCSG